MSSEIKVSPLEGTPALTYSIVLSVILIFFAVVTSSFLSVVLWILTIFPLFMVLAVLYGRLSTKWGRLHYPIMVRYAHFAGEQAGLHPEKPSIARTDDALVKMLASLYPKHSSEELRDVYEEIRTKENVFIDNDVLLKTLKHVKDTRTPEEQKEVVEQVIHNFKKKSDDEAHINAMKLRHVIAELVRFKYGIGEQYNYIYAVITGKAK